MLKSVCGTELDGQLHPDANAAITRTSVQVGNVFVLMFPVIMMILHLVTAAVLWFGGHRIDAGQMEVGHGLRITER